MPASTWLPALALLALPAAAAAQVYKCVDAGGTSYQSSPCAEDQVTAQAWPAIAYTPPAAADLERLRMIQQAAARRAAKPRATTRRGTASRAVAASSIGACAAARDKRDRELDAMGKAGRKIEVRRAADRQVTAACR